MLTWAKNRRRGKISGVSSPYRCVHQILISNPSIYVSPLFPLSEKPILHKKEFPSPNSHPRVFFSDIRRTTFVRKFITRFLLAFLLEFPGLGEKGKKSAERGFQGGNAERAVVWGPPGGGGMIIHSLTHSEPINHHVASFSQDTPPMLAPTRMPAFFSVSTYQTPLSIRHLFSPLPSSLPSAHFAPPRQCVPHRRKSPKQHHPSRVPGAALCCSNSKFLSFSFC